MDNQGNLKIFSSSNGNLLAGLQVSLNNLGGSTEITSLNGNFYIGFVYTFSGQNIQGAVVEYVFNSSNNFFGQNKIYNIPNFRNPGFYLLDYADYSEGYQLLYVGDANNNTICVFNCSTGKW